MTKFNCPCFAVSYCPVVQPRCILWAENKVWSTPLDYFIGLLHWITSLDYSMEFFWTTFGVPFGVPFVLTSGAVKPVR